MKIEITTLEDTHDCETCGSSWASGGIVEVDGEQILYKEPVAHCYAGESYSVTELLILTLQLLGHEVVIDVGSSNV